MATSPVFKKVTVQSGCGHGEYDVRWVLRDESLLAGEAYVYRSFDSSNWGDPINMKNPVVGTNCFHDTNVRAPSNDDTVFYKITIFFNGKYHDSPVGGLYTDLNAREQGLVRRIVNLELKDMRDARNGYRALLFKPLLVGTPCPDCQNTVTGTPIQSSLCPTCYGQRIIGGFADPVETWIRRMNPKVVDMRDMAGGAGVDDQDMATFRGIAFPLVRDGDLIVVPADASRWVVGQVTLDLFRGIVPVTATFEAENLEQGDIRQTLNADF